MMTRASFAIGCVVIGVTTACGRLAPSPRLTSMKPASIVAGQSSRIAVRGARFRMPLDVGVGASRRPLLVSTYTSGEFDATGLPAGRYDIALVADGRVVARLAEPLVVSEAPPVPPGPVGTWSIQLVGTFRGVAPTVARRVRSMVGTSETSTGVEVMKAGDPSPAVRAISVPGYGTFHVANPPAVDVSAALRLRVPASCETVAIDRIVAGQRSVCVRPDGLGVRCPAPGDTCLPPETAVTTGSLAPVRLDPETMAVMTVARVLAPDAAEPASGAPLQMNVAASLLNADAEADGALRAGAGVLNVNGRPFGRVIARAVSPAPHAIVVSFRVDCAPYDGACHQGVVAFAPGSRVSVQLGGRPHMLHIDALNAIDEPLSHVR